MNQVTEIRNLPSKSTRTVSYVQHSGMFLTLARSLSKGREDGGRKPLPHAVLNLLKQAAYRVYCATQPQCDSHSEYSPSYAGARAPRGGVTRQGVVLSDLQSLLDCQ
jgi:hypothetical protein